MGAPKGTIPPNAGKGRKKGVPNKATADIRRAFADLLAKSVPKLEGWLNSVGEEDPARALGLIKDIAEYNIPKLGRIEHTGEDGGPISVKVVQFGSTEAKA